MTMSRTVKQLLEEIKTEDLFDAIAKRYAESVMVCVSTETDIRMLVKLGKKKSVLTSVLPSIANDISLIRK